MTCLEARELLGAHQDGELDPRSDREVARHVAACASCRAELEAVRVLGDALRARVKRRAAPPTLEQRVRRAASADARRAPALVPLFLLAASLALVAIASVLVLARPGPRPLVARDVVNGHVRALLSGRSADVLTSDRHTVKPWLSGRLDFSPPVPDASAAGFALEGGRVESVDGRAVAALTYRRRQHLVSVFVWPEGREPEPRAAELNGFHVRSFHARGMTFVTVSDVAAADMADLERSFRAAVEGEPR